MVDQDELLRRISEVLGAYSRDVAAGSERMVAQMDRKPEIRVYLDTVGVASINDLTPEQRDEMTGLIFRAMNARVHPGAN